MDVQDVIAPVWTARNGHFKPVKGEIDVWRNHQLTDRQAKATIYDAFVTDAIDAPKHFGLTDDRHDRERFARLQLVEVLGRRVRMPTAEDVIINTLRRWQREHRR